MKENVKAKKLDLGPGGGGDACCTPLETPDATVKHLLPKLNDVVFGFMAEDTNMSEGSIKVGDQVVRATPEKYVTKICLLAQECLGTHNITKSKVELTATIKGVDPKDQMRQGDLVSF